MATTSAVFPFVPTLFFPILYCGFASALDFDIALNFNSAYVNTNFELQRADDTSISPVPDTSHNIPMINLTGNPNITDVNKQKYNVGRLKYNQSTLTFPFRSVPSFNTSFTFLIETVTEYNKSGDGIAFALTSDVKPPNNSTGRFLGLTPQNTNDQQDHTFFALEFDTFMNLDPGFDDPSSSHIGINVNSLNSVYIYDTARNVEVDSPLYLYGNYYIKAWLQYNASEPSVRVWATNVTLNTSDAVQRPATPIIDRKLNLSERIHTDQLYAVITATSGNNSEGHSLFAWSFKSEPMPKPKHTYPSGSTLTAIVGVLAGLLAILLAINIFFGAHLLYRRRQRRERKLPSHQSPTVTPTAPTTLSLTSSESIQNYSYEDFRTACDNFSSGRIVGEGGSGIVYWGALSDGTEVAVKKMKEVVVRRDFFREVDILRRLDHPNLLPLLAWCSTDSATGSEATAGPSDSPLTPAKSDGQLDHAAKGMLLVYPYIRNGSLERYIGPGNMAMRQQLGRERRLEILCQVSEALAYLHGRNCVHRDVKPSNVLLTENFDAKVGDFGLARLGKPDRTRVTVTEVWVGTPGFLAPELIDVNVLDGGRARMSGGGDIEQEREIAAALQEGVSYKADVYSFGVVALKVVSGRMYSYEDVAELQKWVNSYGQKEFAATLDPALLPEEGDLGAVEVQQWRCVVLLGLRCLSRQPGERPEMGKVSQALRAVCLTHFPDLLDFLLLLLN